MNNFDHNWKTVDLQKECKRLKLSCHDKKDFLCAKYDKLKNSNFDPAMSTLKNCTITELDRENCRKYFCFHVIALAVNQKFIEMPSKYNKDPIAPKAKAGRKDNAKKCLVK
ncbi:hypothetical protein BpHYR1_041784 [Brachionus plicatilis]|uniref:Uncharacterized protein n=1 Tax=Brachionus plicatilis TaxID=10195 RepID=A0A3M7PSW5_BRAPC|nr:hypothetical protein BpHYR1_041784 [Brachionus plicatilis]